MLNTVDLERSPHLAHMNRIDCSSHKFNKLAAIDADNALETDEFYKEKYESVFKKLNDIWKEKDSRISAEIFSRITGKKLIRPHRIRWMKTHEAVI